MADESTIGVTDNENGTQVHTRRDVVYIDGVATTVETQVVASSGDVTDEDRRRRNISERQQLEAIASGSLLMRKSTYERFSLIDRRGSTGRGINR